LIVPVLNYSLSVPSGADRGYGSSARGPKPCDPNPPTPPPRRRPNPTPELQSQSLLRAYRSILPNSFTNFFQCTRGYSPWRPEAVCGTPTGGGKNWTPRFLRKVRRWPNRCGDAPALPRPCTASRGKPFPQSTRSLGSLEDATRLSFPCDVVSLRCRATLLIRRSGMLT